LRTTIGVPCVSGSVAGQPRIVPGNPSASVIIELTSERGVLQMPPIASRVVDTTDVAAVAAWIQHMSSPAPADAGLAGDAQSPDDAGLAGDAQSPDDAAEGDGGASSEAGSPTDEAGQE
jgi:hypothetical protein